MFILYKNDVFIKVYFIVGVNNELYIYHNEDKLWIPSLENYDAENLNN